MNRTMTTIITVLSADVPVLLLVFGSGLGSRVDGRKGLIGTPAGSVLFAVGTLIVVLGPMASLPNWIVTTSTPEGRVRVCVRNVVIVLSRARRANDRRRVLMGDGSAFMKETAAIIVEAV